MSAAAARSVRGILKEVFNAQMSLLKCQCSTRFSELDGKDECSCGLTRLDSRLN